MAYSNNTPVGRLAARAFLNGKNFKDKNTRVWHKDGRSFMELHGNTIAMRGAEGKIRLSFCGWYTNTTKDRLSALLSALGGGAYILQEKNKVYCVKGSERRFCGNVGRITHTHYAGSGREYKTRQAAQGEDSGFFEV
jgi:hypothetical protein